MPTAETWYFARRMTVLSIQILAAGHLLTECIACPIPCGGFSMMPTLNNFGDAMLISPLPYWRPRWLFGGGRRPARGELVVFHKPTEPKSVVLKRVIAIEGDVVEVDPRRDGSTWSNGKRSAEDRWGEGKYIRVPKGHVWAVGDNLSNSTDSRDYGPVPIASIKAMAVARVSTNSGQGTKSRGRDAIGFMDTAAEMGREALG